MSRKKKVKLFPKKRVRFCSLDYYRALVTKEQSDIEGIDGYTCTDNCIGIFYSNGFSNVYLVNEGEKQLKQVIKIINAYLGGVGDGTQQ